MTAGHIALALAPLAGLAVDCAAHIVVAWLTRGGPLRKLVLGFAAGSAVPLGASLYAILATDLPIADGIALSLLCLATYVTLGYGYTAFVNLNLTSLRIRLLQEVWLASDGLPVSSVWRRYGTEEILRRRIERLTANGQLVQRDGRFYLGKRTFLLIARAIDTARFIVLGSRSVPASPRDLPSGCRTNAASQHAPVGVPWSAQ
jgi:hypothetical protein